MEPPDPPGAGASVPRGRRNGAVSNSSIPAVVGFASTLSTTSVVSDESVSSSASTFFPSASAVSDVPVYTSASTSSSRVPPKIILRVQFASDVNADLNDNRTERIEFQIEIPAFPILPNGPPGLSDTASMDGGAVIESFEPEPNPEFHSTPSPPPSTTSPSNDLTDTESVATVVNVEAAERGRRPTSTSITTHSTTPVVKARFPFAKLEREYTEAPLYFSFEKAPESIDSALPNSAQTKFSCCYLGTRSTPTAFHLSATFDWGYMPRRREILVTFRIGRNLRKSFQGVQLTPAQARSLEIKLCFPLQPWPQGPHETYSFLDFKIGNIDDLKAAGLQDSDMENMDPKEVVVLQWTAQKAWCGDYGRLQQLASSLKTSQNADDSDKEDLAQCINTFMTACEGPGQVTMIVPVGSVTNHEIKYLKYCSAMSAHNKARTG